MFHDFVPDPSLYALFVPYDAQFKGDMGFVRNANRYILRNYRLTMPACVSRIAAYLPDPAELVTPAVTNPLLQPATTIQSRAIRLGLNTPTLERPYGYDAVAAINNYHAPDLSTTSGIFNWHVNTFVMKQNNASTPHRTPDLTNALNDVSLTSTSAVVARVEI